MPNHSHKHLHFILLDGVRRQVFQHEFRAICGLGETCFIAVTFVPSAKGKKRANLLISGSFTVTFTPSGEKTSSEPIEGKVVTLSGTGA